MSFYFIKKKLNIYYFFFIISTIFKKLAKAIIPTIIKISGTIDLFRGLPRWLSGKESACQCRRCSFDPWVGKILWRREWQPTPVFLPRKFHGQRSLVVYSSWGRKGVRYDCVAEHIDLFNLISWFGLIGW